MPALRWIAVVALLATMGVCRADEGDDPTPDPIVQAAREAEAAAAQIADVAKAYESLLAAAKRRPELTAPMSPTLIAYALETGAVDKALALAEPALAAAAEDMQALHDLAYAIVRPRESIGRDKASDLPPTKSDGKPGVLPPPATPEWATTESGKKLAKIAVTAAQQGNAALRAAGAPVAIEDLFDRFHSGLILAEAHHLAGQRKKAIAAAEETIKETEGLVAEIRSNLKELRDLKRSLQPRAGAGGAEEMDDDAP